MKYTRYQNYKDSGIEWIGELPEHWKVIRIKSATSLNPSRSELKGYSKETLVSFFPMESIGDDGIIENSHFKKISEVINGYTYFKDGDVVVAKITPCFENGKGAIMEGLESGLGFGTTELIVIRPSPILSRSFLYFLTRTDLFRKLGEGAMQGAAGQKRITDEFVANFKFGIPPLNEQIQISQFAKYMTEEIDNLITKQQQLIELLKEKRQAVITHAVTKGLDPNVPMKDSGIEWIGKIPEHWDIKRLKYAAQLVTEKSRRYAKQVALENVESWSGRYINTETEFEGEGVEFKESDVLFGKLRPYLAKVYKADFSGSAVGEFFVLRPNSDIESDFLSALLLNREFINLVDGSTYGAKMPRVAWGFMGNLLLAIPPTTEQRNIFKIIDAKTSKIDYLISKQEKMIELLKEHKVSLINQAVTGKIDVRGLIQEVTDTAGQTS